MRSCLLNSKSRETDNLIYAGNYLNNSTPNGHVRVLLELWYGTEAVQHSIMEESRLYFDERHAFNATIVIVFVLEIVLNVLAARTVLAIFHVQSGPNNVQHRSRTAQTGAFQFLNCTTKYDIS